MARSCTICSNPRVQEINAKLAIETPYREIAERFHVSMGALSRHRPHIPVPALDAARRLKAEEVAAVTTGDPDVLTQVRELGTRAGRLLTECENDKDRKHEIAAMREARGLLELQSRLMGQIGPSTAVQVNVGATSLTTTPEWPILMRVLDRNPLIRGELDAALQEAGL